ncbi:sigma-70 family RNA polymerase sigma factor [Silvibacterium acidisoli]|uniref:sigma-70 family RNA polymerase sigma factor n=1 Tax=Acidobacteriaceae bacterium ZG23-2 TaxID=2883246 RepID=UPI00406CCB92
MNECPEKYLNVVRKIAWSLYVTLPSGIEMDDLVGDGCVGLMKAYRSYRADREIPFIAYAYPRIKSEMLQGLRNRGDWRTAVGRLKSAPQLSLDEPVGDGPPAVSTLVDRNGLDPEESLLRMEQYAGLRSMVNALPSRQRAMIEDLYFRELDYAEVVRNTGLTKQGAYTARKRAISALRQQSPSLKQL